jgi:mono/diheme cytochrome c family protein
VKAVARWTLSLAAGLVSIVGLAILATLLRYPRTFDRSVAPPVATTDAAVLARGHYIVYGPGRCADCHLPDDARDRLNRGEDVPLTGGSGEHTYLGSWTAPNLTPDPETGLGGVSPSQFARMMRHGINRRGHIALPFMDAFADLTDADLTAVWSYLRALPPAPGVPPRAEVNLLGQLALAWFIEPYAPTRPIAPSLTPEATQEYGKYVAEALAACGACHTARNLQTGEYTSPPFSGGLSFKSRLDPASMYVSPNLTPDGETGHITGWSEDQFVQRFRSGAFRPDSPMPWAGFLRMTDVDLRAVYRYLRSLPPARHDVGPSLQPRRGQTAG